MQGSATLVRAVRRTADETLHPLEEQVQQRQQAQTLPTGSGVAARAMRP